MSWVIRGREVLYPRGEKEKTNLQSSSLSHGRGEGCSKGDREILSLEHLSPTPVAHSVLEPTPPRSNATLHQACVLRSGKLE